MESYCRGVALLERRGKRRNTRNLFIALPCRPRFAPFSIPDHASNSSDLGRRREQVTRDLQNYRANIHSNREREEKNEIYTQVVLTRNHRSSLLGSFS